MRREILLLLAAAACRQPTKVLVDTSAPYETDTSEETIDTGEVEDSGEPPAEPIDNDGDGYSVEEDCNDDNQWIHPGAEEICDGWDNDCDQIADEGVTGTFYLDSDGDGFGRSDVVVTGCEVPAGFVENPDDCDDSASESYPGAPEICDERDNNCDGSIDENLALSFFEDADGDGYGDPASVVYSCEIKENMSVNDDDCDDNSPDINPSAEEICDEVDNNCDGSTDEGVENLYFYDNDGDGWGDSNTPTLACEPPANHVLNNSDCNDNSPLSNPSAVEVCDNMDNNCDGQIDEGAPIGSQVYYLDADSDGYGDANNVTTACDTPLGYVNSSDDCDDTDAYNYPGATELCDQEDNDCDGSIDEDALNASTWYIDLDGDGYGSIDYLVTACEQPANFTDNAEDCQDADPFIHPIAIEICDGIDNNCDTLIDDNDPMLDTNTAHTWYADNDGDSYGDPNATSIACSAPTGYGADSSDCHDSDSAIYPGASEVCDGIDNDCDGLSDENLLTAYYPDADGDGFGDPNSPTMACSLPSGHVENLADCNDGDDSIRPTAYEVCDNIDQDCDGIVDDGVTTTFYLDDDEDGYGSNQIVLACEISNGLSLVSGDCDDEDSLIHPNQTETCDGEDNDCDSLIDEDALFWYADTDNDGQGDPNNILADCTQPSGYVSNHSDCDDGDNSIYSGALEYCDTIDNNCDGEIDESTAIDAIQWYADGDGDGFGNLFSSIEACYLPNGYSSNSTDCNDSDFFINPGENEWYNNVDDDCDGNIDEDTFYYDDDNDGYSEVDGDCDDNDNNRNPGETEIENGIDDNCNNITDENTNAYDDDGDGYSENNGDCDDVDSTINPGATEYCDGIDNNCDNDTDGSDSADAVLFYLDADLDGYGSALSTFHACTQPANGSTNAIDCNDTDDTIYPGAVELEDSIDNDCDNIIDEDTDAADDDNDGYSENDGDCDDGNSAIYPGAPENCQDGFDNNCDGIIDGCEFSLSTADVKYIGEESGDEAGYAVSFIGDVNNDNIHDILIGAPSANGGDGQAYLIITANSGETDLEDARAIFSGPSGSMLGSGLSGAGDLNDDGREDFMISAPLADSGQGAVYIFYAPFTTIGNVDVDSSADVIITGVNELGHSEGGARSIIHAGDINDDGVDDILLGAYADNSEAGAAYLFYGPLTSNTDVSNADVVFTGESSADLDHAGLSLGDPMDIDGDGIHDIMIAAMNHNGGIGNEAGAVYLIYGNSPSSMSLDNADVKISSEAAEMRAGASVAGVGDTNGDGYNDLLIGTRMLNGSGRAYLHQGPLVTPRSLSNAEATFVGTNSGDFAGWSVAGAGDVDLDGYNDVLIGAPDAQDASNFSGSVYFQYGPFLGTQPLVSADARFTGESPSDAAGFSLTGGQDVNNNGVPDILVGARYESTGGNDAGAVYLILN